jgi:hypothetical protein
MEFKNENAGIKKWRNGAYGLHKSPLEFFEPTKPGVDSGVWTPQACPIETRASKHVDKNGIELSGIKSPRQKWAWSDGRKVFPNFRNEPRHGQLSAQNRMRLKTNPPFFTHVQHMAFQHHSWVWIQELSRLWLPLFEEPTAVRWPELEATHTAWNCQAILPVQPFVAGMKLRTQKFNHVTW